MAPRFASSAAWTKHGSPSELLYLEAGWGWSEYHGVDLGLPSFPLAMTSSSMTHLIGLGPFCPGYAEHQTNLKHV